MKKFVCFRPIAVCGMALALVSCSINVPGIGGVKESGNYISKSFGVKDFHKIKITGSPDVVYVQRDGRPEVQVYGSDNIVDLLRIESDGEELELRFKSNIGSISYKRLDIVVYSPRLEDVDIAGSGTLKADLIESPDFNVEIAGSGDFKCAGMNVSDFEVDVAGSGNVQVKNLNAEKVDANIAGSGDIVLAGEAGRGEFSIAGSGDINISGLKCGRIEQSVLGSGRIKF